MVETSGFRAQALVELLGRICSISVHRLPLCLSSFTFQWMSFSHPVEHLEKGNIFMTLWASAWVLPWWRGSVSTLGNLARGQQAEPGQPCTWDWSLWGARAALTALVREQSRHPS